MAWFTEFRVDDDTEPHTICFFITLNYRLPDKSLLGIEQQAAWCERCRSFGVAEVIPSIEELNSRIQELQTPTQMLLFIYRTQEAMSSAIDEVRVVNGKRLTESGQGFADTADWVAEYSSEGIAIGGPMSQRTSE